MKSALRRKLAVAALALGLLALPVASVSADDGPELFKSNCTMCHGPDGAGKTMMGEKLKIHDLNSADIQKKTDTELKTIIVKGKNNMPAYETKFTKEQIDKLVAYIRNLAKKH